MEKIPTAREFYNNHPSDDCVKMMIDFAKLHVTVALKEASEKAFAQSSRSNFTSKDRLLYDKQGLICVHLGDVSVNEDSILNSYSLDLIK